MTRPNEAPACNPIMPGSANGFLDTPCRIAPEIPRPMPANMVMMMRGRRYSNSTSEVLLSPNPSKVRTTSIGAIRSEPVFKLIKMTITLIKTNTRATVRVLELRKFAFIYKSLPTLRAVYRKKGTPTAATIIPIANSRGGFTVRAPKSASINRIAPSKPDKGMINL